MAMTDEERKAARRASHNKWAEKNHEYRLEYKRKLRVARKIEVLSHYSGGDPVCDCCGETELAFLTLDHINGDGAKHRRENFGSNKSAGTSYVYGWIKRNGFPPIFKVLCFNCNTGRHINGGICPHKQKGAK